MVETVTQREAAPDFYPAVPDGLSAAASALDSAVLWQRIESYIAHRFTERTVTWVVDGAGNWDFPLTPARLTSAQRWTGDAWAAVGLADGPFGYVLPHDGPYRIAATVGDADVPEGVLEAYRRLAEYLAPNSLTGPLADRPGASSQSAKISAGMVDVDLNFDRAPAWLAKAMQYSGAADLLRPYRRA